MFLKKMEPINHHQFVGKKIDYEIELLEKKEKTNGSLGPVIQYVKKRISGIEENIGRISG